MRSGYLLESRLDSLLRARDYYVETNAIYPDPITDRARELDLYAATPRDTAPEKDGSLWAVLLIECINNPQPVAFITKEPLVPSFERYAIKVSGLPTKVLSEAERSTWVSLVDFLGLRRHHHYCRGRVARQFCSFTKKRSADEWMATHIDEHFDAFRKLSAATEYFLDQYYHSLKFSDHEAIDIHLYYPVLVVQGELMEVRTRARGITLRSAQHLQFCRSDIVEGHEQQYHVDVVREAAFPQYLAMIDEEISAIARLLGEHHAPIRTSVDEIARRAQALDEDADIRDVMEL